MRKELLEILACPRCKGDLIPKQDALLCRTCGSKYSIHYGIPDFLVKEVLKGGSGLQKFLYHVYAPFYDAVESRLAKLLGFTEDELRRKIVERLQVGEEHRVLEVCVGTGGNMPYVVPRTKGLIVGLDISWGMLAVCRAKAEKWGWRNLELVRGCAEYLPFKQGVFDRVLIGRGIYLISLTPPWRSAKRFELLSRVQE